MSPGETICFIGMALVEVLYGKIELCGDVLTPAGCASGPRRVFAPRSSPLPVLQAIKIPHDSGFDVKTLPGDIRVHWDPAKTIIRLSSLSEDGLRGIDQVVPVFRKLFNPPTNYVNPVTIKGFHMVRKSWFTRNSPLIAP